MTDFVYRLAPSEYDRYTEHLLQLDQDSRYTRFGYAVTDELIRSLGERIKNNHKAHKIFVIENRDLEIVGAGHIAFDGDSTELAFSVLTDYRQQGLGSKLMERCIEWCQNRNIKNVKMVCLSTNTAIKRLAAKHGVLVSQHGETLATLRIPDPTPFSIGHEVVESQIANVIHLDRLNKKLLEDHPFFLFFK